MSFAQVTDFKPIVPHHTIFLPDCEESDKITAPKGQKPPTDILNISILYSSHVDRFRKTVFARKDAAGSVTSPGSTVVLVLACTW